MKIVNKALGELTPYPQNPRKNDHAVDAVVASLKEFGWKQPLVIDDKGVIVVGHTRYKAAQQLGMETAPCLIAADLTPEQIRAYRIVDNKTAELAEWDGELLALELGEIDIDFDALGLDFSADLSDFPGEVDTTEDEPIAAPEKAFSKLGDLWLCGRHRVLCGDALTGEVVSCDWLITDPPYGIKRDKGFGGAGGFGGCGKPIPRRQYNDDWDSSRPPAEVFERILALADRAIIFGGNFFTDLLPVGNHWIVWDKQNTMPTFGDCELAWTNINRNSVKKFVVPYNGLIGKEKKRFHPTQKPIKIFAEIMQEYTEQGHSVLDPFLGSGSTLIAAERCNRTCYGIELDPRYVDVICQRYYDETGDVPKRESDEVGFPIKSDL